MDLRLTSTDRLTVVAFVAAVMKREGLVGWKFRISSAKTMHGCCDYTKRHIVLSEYALKISTASVEDTILHEIAHALEPWDAHGPRWAAQCVRLGAAPTRCKPGLNAPPKWIATCATCGRVSKKNRLTNRKRSCALCSHGVYNEKYRLTYRQVA